MASLKVGGGAIALKYGFDGASEEHFIMKTCIHNFTPLRAYFYIVIHVLGFRVIYIIFLFLLRNIDCGYSLEQPRRGDFNEYPQSICWAEIWKISFFFFFFFFYLKIFGFWDEILNKHVFVIFSHVVHYRYLGKSELSVQQATSEKGSTGLD